MLTSDYTGSSSYAIYFLGTFTEYPYVCPIVRGKETKFVEFGAKVNNIQIDGISFIEYISFKAFNECIRLKDCIRM